MSKINELNLPEKEASKIKEEILHKEGENLRKQRQKISIFDFEPLKIIGKGAFGEVRVCRYTPTGDIIAIKKMKKYSNRNKFEAEDYISDDETFDVQSYGKARRAPKGIMY